MALEKEINLQSIILKLLDLRNTITLREIAKFVKMSVESPADRRAIQRALEGLMRSNIIQAQGSARSRAYIKFPQSRDNTVFKNISLSVNAVKLLQDIQQPIYTKIPVGYNQDFLKAYHPKNVIFLH